MFKVRLIKLLFLKKLKTLCHGHMLLVILKAKKLFERFTKNFFKKSQKEVRVDKMIKEKGNRPYFK